jgi:hypothetical protein
LAAGGVLVFVIGIALGAGTSSSKKTTITQTLIRTRTVQATTTVVHQVLRTRVVTHSISAPAPPPPATTSGPSDKDFTVDDLQIQDDGLGDIGGVARVTNTSTQSLTATYTFTFFQSGQLVGTAEGSSQDVAPGQTVTVQLTSESPMISGSFRYQFQVDSEF